MHFPIYFAVLLQQLSGLPRRCGCFVSLILNHHCLDLMAFLRHEQDPIPAALLEVMSLLTIAWESSCQKTPFASALGPFGRLQALRTGPAPAGSAGGNLVPCLLMSTSFIQKDRMTSGQVDFSQDSSGVSLMSTSFKFPSQWLGPCLRPRWLHR